MDNSAFDGDYDIIGSLGIEKKNEKNSKKLLAFVSPLVNLLYSSNITSRVKPENPCNKCFKDSGRTLQIIKLED